MSIGRLPDIPTMKKPGWVYALFCESVDGVGYVKIGHSTDPFRRLSGLAGSSPFNALYCGVVSAGSAKQAQWMEESIHSAFAHRRINGEWFKFDFNSPDDKAEFKKVCPKANNGWTFFPFSALREMNRRQALIIFHALQRSAPKGGRFVSRARAHEELRKYGANRA